MHIRQHANPTMHIPLVADPRMHVCECTFSYDCACCPRRSKQGQPREWCGVAMAPEHVRRKMYNVLESYLSSGWEQKTKRFGDTVMLPWQACGSEFRDGNSPAHMFGGTIALPSKACGWGVTYLRRGHDYIFSHRKLVTGYPPRDLGTRF